MFGLGAGELIIIAIVALLALGPDKLPDAAKKIGKGIRDLKRQTRDLQETIENDTQIGDALRDFKAALRGEDEPSTPRPPVSKPERPIPPAATHVVQPAEGQPLPPALAKIPVATAPIPRGADVDEPPADDPSADPADTPKAAHTPDAAAPTADDEPDSSAHG